MENKGLTVVSLCGSSARKCETGRRRISPRGYTWPEMHPLVSAELDDLFAPALNLEGVPHDYLQEDSQNPCRRMPDYVKEEVFEEGLTGNIPAVLTVLRCNGVLPRRTDPNYANIARDCGVDSKTVRVLPNPWTHGWAR